MVHLLNTKGLDGGLITGFWGNIVRVIRGDTIEEQRIEDMFHGRQSRLAQACSNRWNTFELNTIRSFKNINFARIVMTM